MNQTEKKELLFSNIDLRKLILPLVFEQTLAITVGMADTMMISSVGESAVSGVSLVDMLNVLIFGVLSALATGGAVVASFQLGRVLVVSIISGFGTVQIAANGVANSLDSMGCIIGQAMNLAMITVIGRCAGALDQKQVRYYTGKLLLITYLSTATLNVLMLSNLNPILSLYGLSSETTYLTYKLVMIHNGMAIFLWPASFVLPNMLRACNDVKFPMVISIFSMFVFRIGLSYILGVQMGMGAIGVWNAMVVDWIFRTICFVGRYWMGRWKKTMYLLLN